MKIQVKIINKSNNPLPQYATEGAAGMDIRAFLPDGPITIAPLSRTMIHTGIYVQLPQGYEMQVRPRSGLAFKHGITVLNSPGTIDSDYRGEIGVILFNTGNEDFVVNNGDRIAQLVIAKYSCVNWEETDSLDDTHRKDGGFGHTGTN